MKIIYKAHTKSWENNKNTIIFTIIVNIFNDKAITVMISFLFVIIKITKDMIIPKINYLII